MKITDTSGHSFVIADTGIVLLNDDGNYRPPSECKTFATYENNTRTVRLVKTLDTTFPSSTTDAALLTQTFTPTDTSPQNADFINLSYIKVRKAP